MHQLKSWQRLPLLLGCVVLAVLVWTPLVSGQSAWLDSLRSVPIYGNVYPLPNYSSALGFTYGLPVGNWAEGRWVGGGCGGWGGPGYAGNPYAGRFGIGNAWAYGIRGGFGPL